MFIYQNAIENSLKSKKINMFKLTSSQTFNSYVKKTNFINHFKNKFDTQFKK